MLLMRRPSESDILRFLETQRFETFSYSAVGSSRTTPPTGYTVDHNRIQLGNGADAYRRAVSAICAWRMFELGWVEAYETRAPLEVGQTVAVLVRWCNLYFLNACRVAYLVDEQDPIRRFGFAYGTLPEHGERGEERFTVEWLADDSVWYDLLAFSRPNQTLAKVGYIFTRRLQKRFARDSMAAMLRSTVQSQHEHSLESRPESTKGASE